MNLPKIGSLKYAEHDVSQEPRDEAGKWTKTPGEMAAELAQHEPEEEAENPQATEDRVAAGATTTAKEIMAHLADYGDEPIPDNVLNEIAVNADVDKADREAVIDDLYNKGFLDAGEEEGTSVPGTTMKALMKIKELADSVGDDPEGQNINDFQMTNILRDVGVVSPEHKQAVLDTLYDKGLITGSEGPNGDDIWQFVTSEKHSQSERPARYQRLPKIGSLRRK